MVQIRHSIRWYVLIPLITIATYTNPREQEKVPVNEKMRPLTEIRLERVCPRSFKAYEAYA